MTVFASALSSLSQFHRQAPVGVGRPRGQRVEAEGALERAGDTLFAGGCGDDHVEHDPVLQMPPRDGQIREAAGPQVQQRPDLAPHSLSYLRDLCAPRPVRRGQKAVQHGVRHSPSDRGPWWSWSCSASSTFAAPSAIATTRPTRAEARSRHDEVVPDGSIPASASVRPTRSASRRSSTAPACPTSPFPSAVTDRLRSHSVRSLTRRCSDSCARFDLDIRIHAGRRHLSAARASDLPLPLKSQGQCGVAAVTFSVASRGGCRWRSECCW